MSSFQLAILVLEVYIIATIGNYAFLKFQTIKKLEGKTMLTFHIIFMAILPLYATIGLIPDSPIGVKTIAEFYIFSLFMGVNLGSIQSYARAVFAQLTPVGHEAEMFGLYEITDRGSSWIGPIVVAAASDIADMRWAMFYIFFFFVIPLPIVMKIDMLKGRDEAGRTPEQIARRASMLSESAERRELERLGIIQPPSVQPELDDVKEENSSVARQKTFGSDSDGEDLNNSNNNSSNNNNNNSSNTIGIININKDIIGNTSSEIIRAPSDSTAYLGGDTPVGDDINSGGGSGGGGKLGQYLGVNNSNNPDNHNHNVTNTSISNISELDRIVDDIGDDEDNVENAATNNVDSNEKEEDNGDR